jgi:hypothetical protein
MAILIGNKRRKTFAGRVCDDQGPAFTVPVQRAVCVFTRQKGEEKPMEKETCRVTRTDSKGLILQRPTRSNNQ